MNFRDVKSLARYYNTTRKKISKWFIVTAIIIGFAFFLLFSNYYVMPIALCIAIVLNIVIYYASKEYSKRFLLKSNDPEMYKEILLDGYGDPKGENLLKAAYYCGDFQTVVNICASKTKNEHFIYLARMFFDSSDIEALRKICAEFEQFPGKCSCEVMKFFKAFCVENYDECRKICNDRILQNKHELFKVQWTYYLAVTEYKSGNTAEAVKGFDSVVKQGKYLNYVKIASDYIKSSEEGSGYISDVVIPTPDSAYKLPKSKHIFGWKHIAVFLIVCSIGPLAVTAYKVSTENMTYRMKKALSTQYSNFEYIDYLNVMQGEKRIDTLCFFRTSNDILSMSSLITFNNEDWYVFLNFGPVYDGFSTVYVDPHYRYMSDIYICGDSSEVPENAYLTYELKDKNKTLYLYIGNVIYLSDYESDMWYKIMMTGQRSYELDALMAARASMSVILDDFNILDFAWIRKDWKFADYLCVYGSSEADLNTAVFTKDKNKDVAGLYRVFTDLKVGEIYSYTESENKYTISYCFYENKLDAPSNSYYFEEIQVNGKDLWVAVVDVKETLTE